MDDPSVMDLDDYWPPVEPSDVEIVPRHRHHYIRVGAEVKCAGRWGCGALRDEAKAKRGKNSRLRGNAFEREVATKLGGRRVGQYGDKVDVQVDGWLRVQCKNGRAYPERLDGWLRAIPAQADMLRAVVLGDAPGPGSRRRSLIVLDLDEFSAWYGRSPA